MTIVLTYTKDDGTQQQVEFEEDVVEIRLRTLGITDIDLTPLASCTSLEVLMLSQNQLQTINLTPLATCDSLMVLWVHLNQLQTIDLTPLSSLRVYRLRLEGNQFQSEDAIHS